MSRQPRNFPENLALSKCTDHATHGKQVHFYDTASMRWITEKHTHDHEQYMRLQDCKLLADLLDEFIYYIQPSVDNKVITNPNSAVCIANLAVVKKALMGNMQPAFEGLEPYSTSLLYQCSVVIQQALLILVPPFEKSIAMTLYRQLIDLNNSACKRYDVETYAVTQ